MKSRVDPTQILVGCLVGLFLNSLFGARDHFKMSRTARHTAPVLDIFSFWPYGCDQNFAVLKTGATCLTALIATTLLALLY